MEEILFDIPKPLYFESKNAYSGSIGSFSYKVWPADGELKSSVWLGPYCLEKSDPVETRTFPMTLQGREELIAWLTEQRGILAPEETKPDEAEK